MAEAKRKRGRVVAKAMKPDDPIPYGLKAEDTIKKPWYFGKELGSGGCGVVYEGSDRPPPSPFNFVIKVELHQNGPLFTEMHAYHHIGKQDEMNKFTKKKRLNFLGIPACHGTGSFMHNSKKYRFMVIPKYGKDLQLLLNENSNTLHPKTVFTVGSIVINTLEYIHNFGYVHGDVKAGNLLLGPNQATINHVHLVDMGIATRYRSKEGQHKSDKPDPKKSNNGTPEFLSRDAHNGVFCRRSDLEVLAYNMLLWLSGSLPWINIRDLAKIKLEKERYMNDVPLLMRTVFPRAIYPDFQEFLLYVSKLGFEQAPDYDHCINLFKRSLKNLKLKDDGILILKDSKKQDVRELATSSESSQKENNGKKVERKKRNAKDSPDDSAAVQFGEVLTPAMLAVLNRQQERAIEKAVKKPRKKAD